MSKFRKYYILAPLLVLAVSWYPLTMGVQVLGDMLQDGTVRGEAYPKYIIPYTPISLGILAGTLAMPLMLKRRRFALPAASSLSLGVFFLSEFLMERLVIVTTTLTTTLESWQMFMCYQPADSFETRTWNEINVLIGEYSPAFKLHFYFISLVLILSVLNALYGFGHMLLTGDTSRKRALILQSLCALLFLGLCIFACFTAFFRGGELTISSLSALLMCLFFLVFGVTAGVFLGSFLLKKRPLFSVVLPSLSASAVTLIMYLCEMVLLSGHLYRFGTSPIFRSLGSLVLAPADILLILLSGVLCAGILRGICNPRQQRRRSK